MGMAIYMEGYNGIVSISNEDVAVSGQLDFTQTSHLVRPSKNVENTPKIELSTMSFSAS